MKMAVIIVSAAALLIVGVCGVWRALYPEEYDPKNMHYVLWKHGLSEHINLDNAVGGMTHDAWAVNIVKGMSKEQLNQRFGYIRTLDEARPYLRLCYTLPDTVGELGISPHGKEAVFLRDSAWMVILDGRKAVDLVLCKGY
jgi:hypothetical protein